jgi:hypothetical protein
MHGAPDLTVVLRDQGLVSILNADQPLKRRSEPKGMHRPEGIFLATGSGIRRGLTSAPLSIMDVAPIMLYSLGQAIPADMHGRLPESIFEASQLRASPPRWEESPAPAEAASSPGTGPVLDPDEEAAVLSRLKELGYLE